MSQMGVKKEIQGIIDSLDKSSFRIIGEGFGFKIKPTTLPTRSKIKSASTLSSILPNQPKKNSQKKVAEKAVALTKAKSFKKRKSKYSFFRKAEKSPKPQGKVFKQKKNRMPKKSSKGPNALVLLVSHGLDLFFVAMTLFLALVGLFISMNKELGIVDSSERVYQFITNEFDPILMIGATYLFVLFYYLFFTVFKTKPLGLYFFSKISGNK